MKESYFRNYLREDLKGRKKRGYSEVLDLIGVIGTCLLVLLGVLALLIWGHKMIVLMGYVGCVGVGIIAIICLIEEVTGYKEMYERHKKAKEQECEVRTYMEMQGEDTSFPKEKNVFFDSSAIINLATKLYPYSFEGQFRNDLLYLSDEKVPLTFDCELERLKILENQNSKLTFPGCAAYIEGHLKVMQATHGSIADTMFWEGMQGGACLITEDNMLRDIICNAGGSAYSVSELKENYRET